MKIKQQMLLLIEDQVQQARELIEAMRGSYEVTHVRSLSNALRTLRKEHYDAALIDHDLENTRTGIDCAEAIRAKYPAIKIVIYSAFEYTRDREQRVVELGGVFLPKPISVVDLRLALGDH